MVVLLGEVLSKAIFLLRGQIAGGKLYVLSLSHDWQGGRVWQQRIKENERISYSQAESSERGRDGWKEEREKAQCILKCVVKNECEISHNSENDCCSSRWRERSQVFVKTS